MGSKDAFLLFRASFSTTFLRDRGRDESLVTTTPRCSICRCNRQAEFIALYDISLILHTIAMLFRQ